MPNKSTLIKANGYFYVSLRCPGGRLRYPTGVKDSNNLSKVDSRKIERIKNIVDDYVIKHDLMVQPIIIPDLVQYLNSELGDEKNVRAKKTGLIEDHKAMIKKMRSGEILKRKSKARYSEDTIGQYERMRERWKECADDTKSGFVLSYNMTIEHVRALIVWLTQQNYSQNSIYNIINNLRIFLKYSHEEGWHSNEIYRHREFNVPQEEAEAIAPTYDEVVQLYNTQFQIKSQELARDLFVYGCFLALRVNDLNRINDYKLVGNVYEVLTQKTGKKVIIPCHWIAKEIYDKYNGVLPTFIRQTFSRILPKICKAAGITGDKLITMTTGGRKQEKYYKRWELITPHSMRRFFATWMYRDLRRQPREIMAITGHESEESFFKYIKIESEMNAQEISNLPAFKKPV